VPSAILSCMLSGLFDSSKKSNSKVFSGGEISMLFLL
jgi:hypothetical protein